jgi:uncharacterized protein YcfJ
MNNRILASAVAVPLMSACAASAGHRDYEYSSGQYHDYAEVVDVEPIVRTVHVSDPRHECWQEEVHYRDHYAGDHDTAGGMILGGLIGGVIGHQFGHGDDRVTNALAGAILGTGIGHGVASHRSPGGSYDQIGYEERCQTVNDYYTGERVDGYRVTYLYHGETFTTQLPYDPGERLRVRVDVDPAHY